MTTQLHAATPSAGTKTRRAHPARSLGGIIALAFIALVIVIAFIGPLISPHSPYTQDYSHVLSGPGLHHLLGTDQLGRDILSRLLYGTRVAVVGIAETLAVAFILGVVLGVVAGYIGGWIDSVLSRLTDLVLAVPGIVVLLMVFAVTNNSEDWAMVVLGILSTPNIYRVARSATLATRDAQYILSARISGVRTPTIMVRHVLPRVWGPVIVNLSILAGMTLAIQSGLNYLGLGVVPPAPSWGGLVAEAQALLNQQPWLIVPTGLVIALTIVAFIVTGDYAQDLLHGRRVVRRASRRGVVDISTGSKTADTGALLSVRNLSVSFQQDAGLTTVLQDVNFDVHVGESIGIVGESGSGKSVTLSAVLGLLAPGGRVTAGSAQFDGVDLFSLSPAELTAVRGSGIGFVPQEPMRSLDPSYTIGSQLAEFLAIHTNLSRAGRKTRVLELLSKVGIADPARVAGQYPHQISGGMAQRVCIAIALAGNPRLLVADEPTTALDVTVQAEILDLLRELRGPGMALILISHDLGVIADACDQIFVMYAGQLVETGAAIPLLASPRHPYTEGLLRSNPAGAERGQRLRAIPGTVPAPADWPVGCRFQSRCPFVTDACRAAPIPLVDLGSDRQSRCIRIDALIEEESA